MVVVVGVVVVVVVVVVVGVLVVVVVVVWWWSWSCGGGGRDRGRPPELHRAGVTRGTTMYLSTMALGLALLGGAATFSAAAAVVPVRGGNARRPRDRQRRGAVGCVQRYVLNTWWLASR